MARLLGPIDATARYTAMPDGQPAIGKLAVFYAASSGATLADIATYDGTATPGASVAASTLTVDADGLIPVFWFPDGVDAVWVSVNGGTRVRMSADADARLDTLYGQGAGSDPWLKLIAGGDLAALVTGAITRNADGTITSAPVVWPDGTAGVYTATSVPAAFPGVVDAYTVTYLGATTRTVTQPAVTRNAAGLVTSRPAMTVA